MPIEAIDQAAAKMGWRSLLAFGEETNYGERAEPSRSFEFRSESLVREHTPIQSEALRRSEFAPRWGQGAVNVGGDITMELANKGFGLIFKHALGSVTSEEIVTGAHRHTFTPGDLTGLSLSAQVVRDDVPFDYLGCKIGTLALECETEGIATLTATLVGREEQTDQIAHTPAFPADMSLLTFVHGKVELGGSEIAVSSVSAELANGLAEDRRRFGTALRRMPQRNAYREFTGELNCDFVDLSLYNRYVSGEEATLVLTFEGGQIGTTGENYRTIIRSNVRSDGNTPTVEGPEEIRQTVAFTAFPGGDVADAVEVEYITDDDTP